LLPYPPAGERRGRERAAGLGGGGLLSPLRIDVKVRRDLGWRVVWMKRQSKDLQEEKDDNDDVYCERYEPTTGLWRRLRPSEAATSSGSGAVLGLWRILLLQDKWLSSLLWGPGKRYRSVCCSGFVGKREDPCGVLVKRCSNRNLFSLGPNWSPDGLISRVRHYSLSSPTPSGLFFLPYSFQVL
jgi:hypothetical protein